MANTVGIQITGKDDSGPAFKSAEDRVKGLSKTAKSILSADFIKDASAGARSFVTSTIKAASDLGESANAVTKIFGSSSKQILAWGESNAASFGLSKRAFNEAIVPLGSSLRNAGLSMNQVSDTTLNLTKRAADMASVFNTSVGDALLAIQAGLRGEIDPLERYGVSLSAAAVEQQALADSGKKSTSELTAQEKVVARVKIIMAQTATSAGDFADTQNGLANSTRIANAQIEDAKAKIGSGLLPILAKAAKLGGEAAEGFGKLPSSLQAVTGGAILLAAGFIALAPKIMAAKEAVGEIRKGFADMDPKSRAAAKGVAILGAALLAVNVASSSFGSNASKGVNETTAALNEMNKTGFSSAGVLSHLDYDLGTLGSGGLAKAGNAVAGFTESLTGLGSVADESLQHARERIASIDNALAAMVQSGHAADAAKAFDTLSKFAKEQGISMQDLIAGLPQYSEALAGVASQQTSVASSASAVASGFDALGDSLSKVTTPLDAVSAAFDILLGHDNAVLDFNDAQRKLGETLKDNSGKWQKNSEAADENRRALLGAVKDNEALYEANIKSGMSAIDAAAQYDQNTASLEAQLRKAHYTEAQINDLIGAYRGVPGKITTDIATNGLTRALNDLADLIRVIYNIPTSRDIYVRTHFVGGQGQSRGGELRTGGIKGAATGGPQSGLTEVGEEGPELVRLPTGSMVYPKGNRNQMAAGSGGGGGQVLEVRLHLTGSGWAVEGLHKAQQSGDLQVYRSAIVER